MTMRRVWAAGVGALLAVVAACSSKAPAAQDVRCTPGTYVYCRCEDRSEGTKLCNADGASFQACVCNTGDNGAAGDGNSGGGAAAADAGALGDGHLEPVEAGAPAAGPTIGTACVGKLAVVAGLSPTGELPEASEELDVYVAAYAGDGVFTTSKSHGPGVRGAVSVLPLGNSLVATWNSRYSLIVSSKFAAGTWSPPSSVGSNAFSVSETAAVNASGQIRLFYLGLDGHYHMGTYGTNGWDDATALAESTDDAGVSVPGRTAPAAAAAGNSIELAYAGNDGALARARFTNTWSTVQKLAGASAFTARPALTALDPGGDSDVLLAFTGADLLLHASVRDAETGTFRAPTLVDNAATASEETLIGLPGGGAMLVFRGSNGAGYYGVWTPKTGFGPVRELVPGNNPELASLPSLTRGTCGSDVTLGFADSSGKVGILRYVNGAWTGPFVVPSIKRATYVGVGELP